MTQQDPPKIEFPCEDYPVKVMGVAGEPLMEFVLATTEQFAPGFDRSKVTVKNSSKGTFDAITVFITATGIEQLEQYHQTLRANSAVKIVL